MNQSIQACQCCLEYWLQGFSTMQKKTPKTFAIFSGETTENICGWRQMHSTEMYATWRCYPHFSEDICGSTWRGRKSLKAFFISNQTALTSTLTGDMSAGRPKKKKITFLFVSVLQGIDVKSMGRIFVGLVKCGAWGCFDEFNRLEEAVLSAVSMQIQAIQDSLKHHKNTCELLGKEVREHSWTLTSSRALLLLCYLRELLSGSQSVGRHPCRKQKKCCSIANSTVTSRKHILLLLLLNQVDLDPNSGVFITLNPAGKGYGGRQKLPDNLKQLFRPVAMSRPDNELIAEVILYSEGFKSGAILGQKLVAIFNLARYS